MAHRFPARDLLCVESNPKVRCVTLEALRGRQLGVQVCSTASEARGLAARAVLGGIIVAHLLPDASGLELLEELRARQTRLPAILTTDRVSGALTNHCTRVGAHLAVRPHASAVFDRFLDEVSLSALAPSWPDVRSLLSEVRCTARESELIGLAVGGGKTGAEIAAVMGITTNTLKGLVRRVLQKTSAPSMAALKARVDRAAAASESASSQQAPRAEGSVLH